MKLSIIIPVYNVEKYLNICIDSILKQTYKDYEIILVDDGSTDESGKICDEYVSVNKQIRVIHQKNKGLSCARNTGIKKARGKYLMFIDSDDFLYNHNCLNLLMSKAKNDIIQYNMVYYYENSNKYVHLNELPNYNSKAKYINILKDLSSNGQFSISACNKIVKREIIINNNIYFSEKLLSEDIDWSLKLYLHSNSIKIINEEIYVYRQQRKGSITSNIKNKNIISLYKIIKYWYNFDYSNSQYREVYINYLAYQYTILLTILNNKNCSKKLRKDIYKLESILKYSNNKKVILCNKLFKLVGKKIGIIILKMYLFLKNKGIIKL